MQVARVLCAVDLSASSRPALCHAASLAGHSDAELHVLHVIPPRVSGNRLAMDPAAADDFAAKLAWMALNAAVKATDVRQPVVTAVRVGTASCEILRYAAEIHAGLVVLHPHRAVPTHALLGTTVDQVMAHATCPVLAVPDTAANPLELGRSPRYRHVLCPVDFSADALAALTEALHIAQVNDGELTVLHVLETSALPAERLGPHRAAYLRVRQAKAERRLASLLPDSARLLCAVRRVVRAGRPADVISNTAVVGGSDLIVVGGRGQAAPPPGRIGTTTKLVTHTAPCAVLTVSARTHQGLMRHVEGASELALPL